MAVRSRDSSSSVRSLPPPCPKSPPEYPDLYGKRRETAKIQMLEREISFLEEELKSVDSLQPASRYCKEVTDFVMARSDPLIPTNRKNRKSRQFWKWLCGIPCFNLSWICCCCYSGCSCDLKCTRCCDCGLCNCSSCICNLCKCRPCKCCSSDHSSCKCGSSDPSSCKCRPCDCSSCKCSSCDCTPATAVLVNAAARATAVHVSAARVTVAHVQAAAQSQNAAAQSQNGDASAVHATAVHVQAAAQSRNANVSRVLNPVAAAETVAFFNSLHARIAFAANGNVLPLNVRR
ncbi:guanine nucleotide-binding protein subunit gamma 3-like [Hibiscus syriacus]|uniref:guanine nucleotide-binding protein subunit gamma 3-like n=1 Tax=Hibiscus syriacus TaxID=106335 RepID=UPI0019225E76|nr:guanine nucleotide-binding protein subunit gamma 3-like [Hibiscus syriacus]